MNGSRFTGAVRVGRHVTLAVLATLSLFPIYYLLVNSVKGPIAFAEEQWLPPDVLVWENYGRAWEVVARPILNTGIVVGTSLVVLLVLAGMSAYAFAIVRFPGWRVLYGLTFVLLLIPNFLLLIPLYLQISRLPAIAGGYLGIVLPSVAAAQAFSILVLKTAFEQIPRDLLEAARVDGAGELRVLTRVVVPLAWAGLHERRGHPVRRPVERLPAAAARARPREPDRGGRARRVQRRPQPGRPPRVRPAARRLRAVPPSRWWSCSRS